MQAYLDDLCIILQGLPCETKSVFTYYPPPPPLNAVGGEFLILIYLSSINFSLRSLISQNNHIIVLYGVSLEMYYNVLYNMDLA